MKKDKEKKSVSYDEYAQNFWQKIYKRDLNDFLKSAKENLKEEDYIKTENILKLPRMPEGSLRGLFIPYWVFVRPSLPWEKIKNCLKELNMDDKNINLAVFFLKPTYIESTILPGQNRFLEVFKKSHKEICDTLNREIKKLSPLVKRLQNLIEEDEPFKKFFPMHFTVAAMQYRININRAIVRTKHKDDEKDLRNYGISKNLEKSPQKHQYWNAVISRAIRIINNYCHDDNCESSRNFYCKKIHEKAYKKVAKLLKILYPTIWKEDINTIAHRIKQKNYRQIPV